jgi:hypothetical protein
METQQNWRDWDTAHQHVAALGLTLLREDRVSMELNALCATSKCSAVRAWEGE